MKMGKKNMKEILKMIYQMEKELNIMKMEIDYMKEIGKKENILIMVFFILKMVIKVMKGNI
jgi:hypothetical protein